MLTAVITCYDNMHVRRSTMFVHLIKTYFLVFTARCTTVQSTVLLSLVVRPSVRL